MAGHVARGLRNIVNPISCVRYFEYDFCVRQMPSAPRLVLDIGSPRTFPLYLASQYPDTQFVLVNPDPTDIAVTDYYVRLLGLTNVELHNTGLDALLDTHQGKCDCVSSISVIEHVAGDYNDVEAMSLLLKYLKPGGVLALTVPLSEKKQHENEYLPPGIKPYEGTHEVKATDGRFFFQRVYTESSIHERLLSHLGESKSCVEYCGEKEKGLYNRYSHSPMYNGGTDCRFFIDNFVPYRSYAEMPGLGICGISIHCPPVQILGR
jgi:SAM-dependent methyltransferase